MGTAVVAVSNPVQFCGGDWTDDDHRTDVPNSHDFVRDWPAASIARARFPVVGCFDQLPGWLRCQRHIESTVLAHAGRLSKKNFDGCATVLYAGRSNIRASLLTRSDPIGPEFYVPLGRAEKASAFAFYLAAALSVAVLLVDKTIQPQLYGAVQATFAVAVIAFFVSNIVIRTYFAARAHSSRVADFVSNAFSVPLVPSPSEGYYNTSANDPFVRMGASVLENTLFTKSILKKMLQFERARTCIYIIAWLWAAFYRATDLELLAVAAQVLFSEQLLSRWVRMEWLHARVERLYHELYALFQSTTNVRSKEFRARVIESLVRYETSKAQAGVSLSPRVFIRMNSGLSGQWQTISSQLGMAPSKDPSS